LLYQNYWNIRVSRIVAFISKNIDILILFACLVGWLAWFFTSRNLNKIKVLSMKNCMGYAWAGIMAGMNTGMRMWVNVHMELGMRLRGPQSSAHCVYVCDNIRRYDRAFHRFGQAKFPDGGLILGLSQFSILPQLQLHSCLQKYCLIQKWSKLTTK